MPNTVLGDASRLIPELTARNLGENARVGSGIRCCNCGKSTAIVQVSVTDRLCGYNLKRPSACTGQQLIPEGSSSVKLQASSFKLRIP